MEQVNNALRTRDYLRRVSSDPVIAFKEITKWADEEYDQYDILLSKLKALSKSTVSNKKSKGTEKNVKTKDKGDSLESIVNFIIEKSFLLNVFPNKRTATNEIDQFVVMSDSGKQAVYKFDFSPDLLGFNNGYFLGECKNYNKKVAGTWVGKFYTLLKSCGNCNLGIIFSYYGLAGEENNWNAAHGLTKLIYRIEPDEHKIFIIDININDFERIADRNNRVSFFDIINYKREALKSGIKSESLMLPHKGFDFVKNTKCEVDQWLKLDSKASE